MLGTDLMAACKKAGIDHAGFALSELDITRYETMSSVIPETDFIVNCAGYTLVDEAEVHREEAFSINAEGARNVARAARRREARLIHLSTDYVFDGTKPKPYTERDQPCPLNVYGASKLAGEKAIRAEGCRFMIVRTQSLFGASGRNFIKSIVRQLQTNRTEPLRVVSDQVSAPTYTVHLADAILRLLRVKKGGVVHVAASHECSWYDFAQAIVARVKPGTRIEPVLASHLGLPAHRPAYSVLDKRRYTTWTKHVMPTWEEGLVEYLKAEGWIK
jgi:dTDP-4-dehydrorhamnose reductase